MSEKLSKTRLKEIENAAKNRREIIAARLSRREMLKMGLLTSAGMLVPVRGLSARWADPLKTTPLDNPISPPTTPFLEELPTHMNGGMVIKSPEAVPLNPAPTVAPNTAAGEGRTRNHQALTLYPPVDFYRVSQQQGTYVAHPQLPPQTIWGFDGRFPGPTYVARYGRPVLIRNINNLPVNNGGFGVPSVTTHLHNGHTPSESDGYPCDFFERGQWYDQHYPNILAGARSTHQPNGDLNEALSTLWYHDHRVDFTAQNVYKGLAGFYLLFNHLDTGDETTGFRLPKFPEFDIPLMIADKVYDPQTGQAFFDLANFDGILGDKTLVNGKIQPFFSVHPRRYRFRILNTGPSRFVDLYLTNPNNLNTAIPMWQISSDGNLLPKPVQITHTVLSVAERADIIIDFSQFAPGTVVYLENRMEQTDGRGPTGDTFPAGAGTYLLKFIVDKPPVADGSANPATITSFYGLPSTTAQPRVTRTFKLERKNGMWAINGQFATCLAPPRFKIQRNSVERWILQNNSGGWEHPMHIHFEEFQILKRNGVAIPNGSVEKGRKDVVRVGRNQVVELFFRFRDFDGLYAMHCHNSIHEDHAMMVLFEIAAQGDLKTEP